MKNYYVYILASKRNGTLYVGVTNDLLRRLDEHREKISGFTSKYGVQFLVYYEVVEEALVAIEREKKIKNLNRKKKLKLIESINPDWEDLSLSIVF